MSPFAHSTSTVSLKLENANYRLMTSPASHHETANPRTFAKVEIRGVIDFPPIER